MALELTVDSERLQEIILAIITAKREGRHVFFDGHTQFLPQHHLPPALENDPLTTLPKDPLRAAHYLYTEAYFEKRVRAPYIIRRVRRSWDDISQCWIFDPYVVADTHLADIEHVFATTLNFGMNNFRNVRKPEPDLEARRSAAVRAQFAHQESFDGMLPRTQKFSRDQSRPEQYRDNARLLVTKYEGDPRRLVDGLTVDESRARIMQLGGFGEGITNLLLTYYMDRELARVTDPKNLLPKVDVHKGRIPLNTNVIPIPEDLTAVPREYIVELLQPAYRDACNALGIPTHEADNALWILGSEVCATRNYHECIRKCPVYDLCEVNTPTAQNAGTYLLRDHNGKRVESRTRGKQAAHVHTNNTDMLK